MEIVGWHYLVIFVLTLVMLTKPMGLYIAKVLDPKGKTWLDPIIKPLELLTFRICKIDPLKQQNWKEYLFSVLSFSIMSFGFTFLILGLQEYLPLNPQKLNGISHDLNFNITSSFLTNTNWQSYVPEITVSYFSQMFALTVQNFVSPAVGLSVAACLVKGLFAKQTELLSNFWVDLIRTVYYLLLPLSIILSVFFISQGVPQNFKPFSIVKTLEQKVQVIVQGPIASQEAIKLLGTNGGGYTNANSAHPYENPTPISNFIQILAILLIPAGQFYYLGKAVKNTKHGWSIFVALAIMFIASAIICSIYESEANPIISKLGADSSIGNMEGKEQRFGIFGSSLYAAATTVVSCGATNSALGSFTPIGGLLPMLNIQLGEVIFGGVGAGLFSVLLFIFLAVFLAGLIIGRTPEYLGKKIESLEMKLTMIALLTFILVVLGSTAITLLNKGATNQVSDSGPHGFSEILYAFSSCAGNNGSGFEGLSCNTVFYNIFLGFAMIIGRFCYIIPVIAMAGSFARKKKHFTAESSFPVHGMTFVWLLIGIILLIGALTFLPALVMGPIMENFFMMEGKIVP